MRLRDRALQRVQRRIDAIVAWIELGRQGEATARQVRRERALLEHDLVDLLAGPRLALTVSHGDAA
jgi:hypothetical protein